MPDHLHTLLSFGRDGSMSAVIRDWKPFHLRINHVSWQDGYFDHRLRADERGTQLSAKIELHPAQSRGCRFVPEGGRLALGH
jgi:REP-associated tyrosine transposase